MISFIQGELSEIGKDQIVVATSGMGFEISVPATVIGQLPGIGMQVKIYTYMYVREDIIGLFGFLTRDDLSIFKKLISVSGVGPKGALGILSVMNADELVMAVMSEDVKALSKAPGIGAKTARRMILDLKDKVNLEEFIGKAGRNDADGGVGATLTSGGIGIAQNDTILALTALGYSSSDALRAVRAVENADGMDSNQLLKQALRHIMTF